LILDTKKSQRVVWPGQPARGGRAWTCKASWKSDGGDWRWPR